MTIRSSSFIGGSIFILAFCLVGWLGIIAPLQDLDQLRITRTDAQISAEIFRQQIQNQSTTTSRYNDLVEKEKTLSGLVWKRTDQLALLTTLERLASTAGVQSDLSLSDIPGGTDIVEVPITLTIHGTWPAVVSELRALEQLQPLIFVDSISLQATSLTGVAATLTAKSLWL